MNVTTYVLPNICGQGLSFNLDGFRIVYITIAVFMWIITAMFNPDYMQYYQAKVRYYVFTWITFVATCGVFLSADFYTTFIFFEIMSIASYVWVAFDERDISLRAAGTYLAVAVIGGLVMLMGIFLLQDMAGTLSFEQLSMLRAQGAFVGNEKKLFAISICMLIGFGAKAGVFPLHIWLPKAHPVAPAPASALLSGILTKTGIFGVLILSRYLIPGEPSWDRMILTLGIVTMLIGAVLALVSIDLKATLACSSVSQIGFIMTGIGTAGMIHEEGLALQGAMLHMVNHSLIKLTLFCAAGVVYMNLHALDLNTVRGFGRGKKLLTAVFALGALGIGGIPMFNGYISKTLLHEALVKGGLHTEEMLFLLAGGFTVAYMLKLFVCIFVERNPDDSLQRKFDETDRYCRPLTAIALSIAAVTIPLIGGIPTLTANRIAALGLKFLRVEEEVVVPYFAWANLKGGLISIAIGIVLYLLVVRKLLMKDNRYINVWPEWMDLENLIYRPLLLKALPGVFRVICRIIDSLVDTIVVMLRHTVYKDVPIKNERIEGSVLTDAVAKVVALFDRMRRPGVPNEERKDYRHIFALRREVLAEDRIIMLRSTSFSLLLFSIGLIVMVVYLFVRFL